MPQLDVYGYELCPPGVEISRLAAEKFDIPVSYEQLDYLRAPQDRYVFPKTDVAFTMFSIEQLPRDCGVAVGNMLDYVRLGTFHIEPVPENYPISLVRLSVV